MRFARFAAASAALTIAVGGLGVAFADQPPAFHQNTSIFVVDNGDGDFVRASGSIIRLGQNEGVTVQLTAQADVDCILHQKQGDKVIKGLHQEVSSAPVTLESDHNGTVKFEMLDTAQVTAKCPGKKMDEDVHFTEATLTATTADGFQLEPLTVEF